MSEWICVADQDCTETMPCSACSEDMRQCQTLDVADEFGANPAEITEALTLHRLVREGWSFAYGERANVSPREMTWGAWHDERGRPSILKPSLSEVILAAEAIAVADREKER